MKNQKTASIPAIQAPVGRMRCVANVMVKLVVAVLNRILVIPTLLVVVLNAFIMPSVHHLWPVSNNIVAIPALAPVARMPNVLWSTIYRHVVVYVVTKVIRLPVVSVKITQLDHLAHVNRHLAVPTVFVAWLMVVQPALVK